MLQYMSKFQQKWSQYQYKGPTVLLTSILIVVMYLLHATDTRKQRNIQSSVIYITKTISHFQKNNNSTYSLHLVLHSLWTNNLHKKSSQLLNIQG